MTSFVCINCIDDRHSLVFTKNTDILKTSKEAKVQTDREDTTCSTKVCVRRSVMIPVISPFNIHHNPDNSSEQRKSPSDHIHIQAFSRSVLCPFLLLRWNRQLGPHLSMSRYSSDTVAGRTRSCMETKCPLMLLKGRESGK